jgi:hypothetical protein
MAGLTLAQAEARLTAWMEADASLQTEQEVRFGDRMLKRADAAEVRNNIDFWQKKCQELSASSTESGRGRSRTVSPNW